MGQHTARRKRADDAGKSAEKSNAAETQTSMTSEAIDKSSKSQEQASHMVENSTEVKARPLALDPAAVSASPEAPAFIAKPEGAPPYYGFQVLEDSEVDGFQFGKITDFDREPAMEGEGFVVAPDDSRAGLIWHISEDISIKQFSPPERDCWGVWEVSFPHAMTSHENVRLNLASIAPALKEKWLAWKDSKSSKKQAQSRGQQPTRSTRV